MSRVFRRWWNVRSPLTVHQKGVTRAIALGWRP
jgi:hypothetical protein